MSGTTPAHLEAVTNPSTGDGDGKISTGSSIVDPTSVEENGRTYHNYDTNYLLPNDGVEQDRLDLQHHIHKLLLNGKLGLAPVENPNYALDIATGTGIWAIEYAGQHPHCNVVGTDLSKIQPNGLVPNCTFEKEDSEKQEWAFPYLFDYTFNHLQPGGWLEFQEPHLLVESYDGTHGGTIFQQIMTYINQAGVALGRIYDKAVLYEQWLSEAGFKDITCHVIPWPVGAWPVDSKFREIGQATVLDFEASFESFKKGIQLGSGLTAEEVDKLIVQAKAEFRNPGVHSWVKFYVVFGRKPIDGELAPEDAALTGT